MQDDDVRSGLNHRIFSTAVVANYQRSEAVKQAVNDNKMHKFLH